MDHYIILNGTLQPATQSRWDAWIHSEEAQLKLRETQFIRDGKVWGRVATYFTGCDECPGSDEPYLWQTRLFDGAPFGVWRYTRPESAADGHDRYVRLIVRLLKQDGIELGIVEVPQENI